MTNRVIPELTVEQIEQYNFRVPRYTSYPAVPNWNKEYDINDHLRDLKEISDHKEPLSLYFHIPFCIRRCLFCACNVLVTQKPDRVTRYLDFLKMEIKTTGELLNHRKEVIQLHFGGGTPTHISPEQMHDLLTVIHDEFNMLPNAEKSIEIHPSVTSDEHTDVLSSFKFNRLSVGVQDFDPKVQEELNRHQTYEETTHLIDYSKKHGLNSVNADLIYGLPYQTKEGFSDTLDKILEIKPDRIALYSFAHFPSIFPHHKHIPLQVIPQGENKLNFFLMARKILLQNGYQQIGFDHFALPDDELSLSYENKTLRRNFMGYTTKTGTDLIAFGYSGISELSNSYGQNSKDMKEYEMMIEKYGRAVVKGHHMSEEDKIRKELIMKFLCQGEFNVIDEVDSNGIGKSINKKVEELFPRYELEGLVTKSYNGWITTELGNMFARIMASSFDQYYEPSKHLFSKSI